MSFTNLWPDKWRSKYKDFILSLNIIRFAVFIHFVVMEIFNLTTYINLKI